MTIQLLNFNMNFHNSSYLCVHVGGCLGADMSTTSSLQAPVETRRRYQIARN